MDLKIHLCLSRIQITAAIKHVSVNRGFHLLQNEYFNPLAKPAKAQIGFATETGPKEQDSIFTRAFDKAKTDCARHFMMLKIIKPPRPEHI
jgi:hypothetical protein